ncbi:uncharacterized protein [Linepithema humile]|uniref:uncharacterized protein n=1 Tax=Linepithema humile TaxID=83485 RepID=UPI00351E12EE
MHTYNSYANTTLGHSDEIRIPIQQQDLYTLPCESFLYIEGKLVTPADENRDNVCIMRNNCVPFMFDKMRYEFDGVEIDRNRNVGITTTIKNYISLTTEKSKMLKHASWNPNGYPLIDGNFNFCVPLNTLLGFCEDYKRIVINARHELVLIRSRNDNNCLVGRVGTNPKIELLKIQWRMPHVSLSEVNKLSLLRTLENFYPYDDMNLDFDRNRYAILYNMYARFRKAYYGFDNTYLDIDDFLKAVVVVIDCSRQNDSVKSATVDVRIEFDCKENIPTNTTAYCLIIHDRMVEYNPLNNIVRRLV